MRYGIRALVIACMLLVMNVAAAQSISDVAFDEDVLIDLTGSQTSAAFNLSLDAAGTINVNVRYLGQAFPLTLEAFDAGGQPAGEQTTSAPADLPFDLDAGEYIVIASAPADDAGRAILRFSLGDAAPADDLPPVDDGDPLSGEWLVTYVDDYTTNCPEFMSLAESELPLDGSTHTLTFSTPPAPLDFHRVVAPDGVEEVPEFFETQIHADDTYEVVPGIQTAPYTYRYTVNNSQSITLAYLETISLSDCEATVTVELTFTGDAGVIDDAGIIDTDDPAQPEMASIADWSVLGDAGETGTDDFLCSVPSALGATWLFDAPDAFVNQVVNGYGEMLAFDLRRRDAVQTPASATVTLVVGNAVLLNYTLDDAVTDSFTRFEIPLTETAGWVDVDGMFDTTDAGMFQQLLSDVTRVQISEFGADSDGFCLQNPTAGDAGAVPGDTPAPSGTIPYYVIGPTDDGGGVAVGCDGYMLPQDSGRPFTEDAAMNIRESLEPVLAMPSTEVPGTNYTNYLGGQGLSVGQIDINNGHATVVIEGSFLLLGACADPQIEAQFLLGIFADPRIESATVITNGENLKAIADMSGQTPPDAVYTRDDIRERDF